MLRPWIWPAVAAALAAGSLSGSATAAGAASSTPTVTAVEQAAPSATRGDKGGKDRPDATPKKPPVRGTAIVRVRGSEADRARIIVIGPGSFQRVMRGSGRVKDLPAGTYSIEARQIRNSDGTARPKIRNREFRVSHGKRRIKVRVRYTFTAYEQPDPGTGLSLVDRRPDSVEMLWVPPAGQPATGVVVRRSVGMTPPGSATDGDPVSGPATAGARFSDVGLAPSSMYSYSVFADGPGGSSGTPVDTLTVRTPQQQIFAAGDIGWCGGATRYTAQLIPAGSIFLGLGDLAYFSGTKDDFRECYHPFYGRLRSTTFPTPGNHEYRTGTEGYRSYFGHRVGTRAKPWYSVRVGSWRFLMLDSDCAQVGGCGPGSRQYRWVADQVAAAPSQCLAAAWHHPQWETGAQPRPSRPMTGIHRLLESAGADFILTGHLHRYERFARVAADGYPSVTGIRQFVVGTGGAPLKEIDHPLPTLESVIKEYGVLRLNLDDDGYSWQFVAIGDRVLDSGHDTCA